MLSIFKSLLIADLKAISGNKILMVTALSPILLIILLKFTFAPIAGFVFSGTGLILEGYYPVIAITFVSFIPVLFGIIQALMLPGIRDLYNLKIISDKQYGKRSFQITEMVTVALFSFILLLICIFLTNPVATEGWLRTTYISVLLSVQSSFIFLLIVSLSGKKVSASTLSILSLLFLVTIPFGLLLHHPWTYLAFFSPFYWISWAWVTHSVSESLLYGAISMLITSGCIVWFSIHYLKKHTN